MAVTVLDRARARSPLVATTLAPGLLLVALIPPALDFLVMVQPVIDVPGVRLAAAAVAAALLAVLWGRYPRTTWLAAAALAAVANVALRLVGADLAPVLSLLSVLALGIGGAFASRAHDMDSWMLEPQPSVARR
jgi:hypothetical protein